MATSSPALSTVRSYVRRYIRFNGRNLRLCSRAHTCKPNSRISLSGNSTPFVVRANPPFSFSKHSRFLLERDRLCTSSINRASLQLQGASTVVFGVEDIQYPMIVSPSSAWATEPAECCALEILPLLHELFLHSWHRESRLSSSPITLCSGTLET